jgi:hypothetical protein
MQAGEHPPGRGVREQPVHCLARPQPPARSAGHGWESLSLERLGRDAVAGRGADRPGPPPHFSPRDWVEILPAADCVHDVCELLVAEGLGNVH